MLRVKDWPSFQSYKDRKPPWIRLHKALIDNFEFQSMSANARALLPMLWLLASEDKDPVSGLLRDRYEKIAFRLRMPVKDVEEGIEEAIKNGFIERLVDNNQKVTEQIHDRYETVTPETETETETEVETDSVRKASPTAPSRFDSFWSDYPIKREKKKARDIWRRKKLDSIADTIIDDVRMRKAGDKHWLDGFIPHPTTYLNGERWDDEVTPPGERDNDATIQRVGMFPDD